MDKSLTTLDRTPATRDTALGAALAAFDRAADRIDLSAGMRDLLRAPMHEHHVAIPVRMDDGTTRVFRGVRVQHNDARGPYKGGIRFHPSSTIDDARALAMWMTWKTALVDLPLGGAKGLLCCDPRTLSEAEQERLCRGWVRQMARAFGPDIDVPAPDVMTSSRHMLWMLDELEAIHGRKLPGAITGKPVGKGGSEGRTEATGFGAATIAREALLRLSEKPARATASIQGFGNVAQHAARHLAASGISVRAVSSWHAADERAYTFRKPWGIDVDELAGITDAFGSIDRDRAAALGYEVLPGSEWLEQAVDILIPAALEGQINDANAPRVHGRVRLIVEAANGPTTPEAAETLEDRGVVIVPDVLANAGGVTCSYFEQVQSNSNYYWPRREVLHKLDAWLTRAYRAMTERAEREHIGLREAAYVIAVDRVAEACRERGWAS